MSKSSSKTSFTVNTSQSSTLGDGESSPIHHIASAPQRSISSMKELLLGIVLPIVGLEPPQEQLQYPVVKESDEPIGDVKDFTSIEMKAKALEEVPATKTSLPVLPISESISISFKDICVDVKVQAIETGKVNIFSTIFSRLGLGGGGPTSLKRVLHNLSGKLSPGRLVALMGSSGAGKSTFLNVLSHRVLPSEGLVTYSDTPVSDEIVQRCSAFVQQLDIFLEHLTVHEQIDSQIRLRVPELKTKDQRSNRENDICNHLSLVKCLHNQIGNGSGIGGISGGERKRLNVASEVLTIPTVLFADEPTTGLDSFMAESVVKVLRKMAESGRTVVATIHQPSSKIFDFFHDLILVAEGRLIYLGDRLGCIEWFKRLGFECPPYTNPADFIIKALSISEAPEAREEKLRQIIDWSNKWKNEGEKFIVEWNVSEREKFLARTRTFEHEVLDAAMLSDTGLVKKSSKEIDNTSSKMENKKPTEPEESEMVKTPPVEYIAQLQMTSRAKVGWCKQVLILYQRAINSNKRDKFLIHARALQTIILGLLYGFLMFQLTWSFHDARTKLGGCFNLVLNQSMAGSFSVINTFISEKPVIRRELESGLISPSAYIIGKMLADAPIQIVFPTIFATITWWLMDLNSEFVRFLIAIGIILLVSNAAVSIGYFASAVASGPDIAYIISNLCVLPLILFGGFMIKLDDAMKWLSWIQYISFVKYGYSNMVVTVFHGEKIYHPKYGEIDGMRFLDATLGIRGDNYMLWFIMLAVLLIVYRLASLIAFPIIMRRSKENA